MKIRDWKNNKKAIQIIKIIVCIMISFFMVSSIAQAGLKSFQSYTDYKYEGTLDNVKTYENVTEITQQFIANGKILSNVELYFTNIKDIQFKLTILDNENETLFSSEYNEREFSEKQWNPVGVNLSNLKKGYSYTLKIQGTDLSNIPFDSSNMYPKVFEICKINGEEKSEIMVLGLQGTHVYWGSGAILGCVHYIMMVLLGGIICYVILKFEQIYEEYRKKKQKGNWLFAIYFSLLMVFSINPLTESQNQISEFKRIIGQGVNDGLDVSKRISNFNCWFICFAFSYVIFYLFANDLKKKCVTSERQKTFEKMNNTVILAVVLLGLRSFSFFLNSENLSNWLEYSDYMLFAIVMIELIYICFNLNKKIAEDCMEAGVICCWMLAFPITIISSVKWCSGKSLMGVQWIVTIIFMLWVILSRSALFQKKDIQMMVKRMTVFFACIPFLISVYIESLAILNQHGIFVGNVKRNFIVLFAGWTAIAIVVTYSLTKKKRSFSNWKQYAYPIIVFGTSCLWCQIPITGVYNADIFESANTSVLISDFFNYGDIPIVQHYGGHMMTSVWEGILYGVLNNDSQGAIISPYGGYVAVLVSVLFFYLIKNLLDEDIAVLMTLMFPFYNVISYWGLGILVCLAVMLFVKKNTYVRAAFVWFAFIWCTLYRLDLGFAFFVACITTLLVYIIKEKNKKACMQLLITFIAWVVIGIITWFVICVIKGINPIERLIEFFKLNMSNQNWAYSSIGNAALPNFTWTYIIIPFAVVIGLVYLVFSEKTIKKMGWSNWVITLILGFAYVFNFSRGLVRHSLAEGILMVAIWSAYLFLAIGIGYALKNKGYIIPAFAILVVMNGWFLTGENFSEKSIADSGVGKIGEYTATWSSVEGKQTYWEELKAEKKIVQRVEYDENLKDTIKEYGILINMLLADDETFVDYMNRSFLYSALGRRNPVYASQSPLQLSGEYTQECFIKQIENVPLVLMPYGKEDVRLAETMDTIPNLYRYYKVSEYIFQNYVPLCVYGDEYALWCLPERYDSMAAIIKAYDTQGADIKASLLDMDNLVFNSVTGIKDQEGNVCLESSGEDPQITELQNVMDLTPYIGQNVEFEMQYESGEQGKFEIFYTTESQEEYCEDHVISEMVQGKGTLSFTIPVTEFTRIRMDIPDCEFKIMSFTYNTVCKLVQYGYDDPYFDGEQYVYLPGLHQYEIRKLPLIWAEMDEKKAVENSVVEKLERKGDVYAYKYVSDKQENKGNYMKIHIEYDGTDTDGKYLDNDETIEASLAVGRNTDDGFDTKYTYKFIISEGQHDYLFRVSSDYYWYTGDTNAVKIDSNGILRNVSISILEGD